MSLQRGKAPARLDETADRLVRTVPVCHADSCNCNHLLIGVLHER